jgi:hypothetical protein
MKGAENWSVQNVAIFGMSNAIHYRHLALLNMYGMVWYGMVFRSIMCIS